MMKECGQRVWRGSLTMALALGSCLWLAGVPAARAETLQDAVADLIAKHPEVQAGRYNRLARDQEVRQARSGYMPKVDIMGGVGIDDVNEPFDDQLSPREYVISLRQNLFTGFATMNEVDRQKARVRSGAYALRATTEHAALKAARVYLEVLRNQQLVDLAQENLQLHERIADQISLRSESGVDRRADMDQVQSRLALAQSNMVVTRTNLADAETNYLAVMGHLPSQLSRPELPDAFMPATLEQAVTAAIEGHAQLKSAQEDVEARKFQDKVARSPYMPVLDVEVDKTWSEEVNYSYDKRDDVVAMLRLRYNLFQGFKDDARKKETAHLINEARETRNNTHRQVEESIRLSWMAHKNVRDRLGYLENRWKTAEKTAASYGKQWDIGKRTLLDVLDAEAEKIEAKKDLLNAHFDGQIAQYRILDGTGALVQALGLSWPEEAKVGDEDKGSKKAEDKEQAAKS